MSYRIRIENQFIFKKSRSHQPKVFCAIRSWAAKETAGAVMNFSISRLGHSSPHLSPAVAELTCLWLSIFRRLFPL